MGRFSCHFSNKKGRDIGHGLFYRNKKSRGVLEEVPTASNHFNSCSLAVDKPLPMAILPPPISHAVELVRHLLPADPFFKSGFFLPDFEQRVKRNLQKITAVVKSRKSVTPAPASARVNSSRSPEHANISGFPLSRE